MALVRSFTVKCRRLLLVLFYAHCNLIAQAQGAGTGREAVFVRTLIELEGFFVILFHAVAEFVALAQQILGAGIFRFRSPANSWMAFSWSSSTPMPRS